MVGTATLICLLGRDWGGRGQVHSWASVSKGGLASPMVPCCGLAVCALELEVSLDPIGYSLPILKYHWYLLLYSC
jgi:hypothetical protein